MTTFFLDTSYVLALELSNEHSRGLHSKAVEVGNRLLVSVQLELIQVDEALFIDGWQFFQQHVDKSYSLTDCISFRVMAMRGVNAALTLNKHFTQAGFQKLPEGEG